jgi:hypothetical protein
MDWDADGLLHVVDIVRRHCPDGTVEERVGSRWVDPATGAAVRTGPEGVHPDASWFEGRYWWKRRHLGGRGTVFEWPEREISRTLPPGTTVFTTWRPGFLKLLRRREGSRDRDHVLLDMATGEERVIESWFTISFDGRYLATRRRVVDLDADRTVAGPWPEDRFVGWRSPGSLGIRLRPQHAHAWWREEDGTIRNTLVDLATGEELALPAEPHRLAILPDGRIVVRDADGRTVDLLDAKGKTLRRLYGPRDGE